MVGCAITPEENKPVDVNAAWESRQARLYKMQTWRINASLAVRVKDEGWQAGMHWHQQEEYYEMDLLDPFKRKVAKLKGGPHGVKLTTANGETAWASDAESLMSKLLGYSLPVSGLRYWVRGIPDPQVKVEEFHLDDAGRLAELKQSGWEVGYQRYHKTIGLDMPEKLTFINQRAKVKMVVNSWQLSTQ